MLENEEFKPTLMRLGFTQVFLEVKAIMQDGSDGPIVHFGIGDPFVKQWRLFRHEHLVLQLLGVQQRLHGVSEEIWVLAVVEPPFEFREVGV